MANVSKSISIPNEEFSDDTTPSVARKFLNEVKSTIVTLQRVVKQKMTLDIHNWSSSAHQEIHKIVKDEIFPIINQVDARVQNFKILYLKETAKFVRDFQSLANEADESLAKHKALELEIEGLLRAVVSQDIMFIVQNNSVVGTSNLQTELERTKECFENRIIKKENEYAKLWNDWYKKCEECKYDKISYDKAYNDMQQKIKRLQAQLGYQKGKSKDTQCVSNTLDPLPHKLENKNIELEFQNNLHDTIYENAKLRAQLFDKVSEQKDTTKDTVTSNSVPTTNESKVVDNDKVIAPGMFRINPFKNSREEKPLPNKPTKASVRINPVTASQPHVIIKKVVNYDSNGFSSTGVDINKVEVEDHPRNLLLSKNKKHMLSECNNIKLAIRNDKSEIVCAMCKQCLITANHDACVLNYVNGMNSRSKKQKANVSNIANQMKHKAQVWKPKNVGSKERLASLKPSKPNMRLRWSPTGKRFDIKGKIIASSELNGENACTPNPQEPTSNGYQIPPFSLAGYLNMFMFLGTVCFGNDHVAAILGFGDLQWGNILIIGVYFVEGLGHNLFSVGQFCNSDLENDREDIGKLGAKGDIGFFIGYSANSCAYRVYNRRIKRIMEAINLTFDKLSAMAFKQSSLKPGLQSMTSRQISSGLDLPFAPSTITTQRPTKGELDLLFEAMYNDHVDGQPSDAPRTVLAAQAPYVLQTPTTTTTTADTALTPTNSFSLATSIPSNSQNVDELETQQHGQPQPASIADNVPNAMFDDNTFVNPFTTPSTSAAESSSSQYVDPSNMHTFYKPYPHEFQ
ncbi:hypothetical protein Tco_0462544 [Tanacetum coccineum]